MSGQATGAHGPHFAWPRQVLALNIDHSLVGRTQEPQPERHGTPTQKLVQTLECVSLRFLYDVRRINSRPNLRPQAATYRLVNVRNVTLHQ